MTFLIFVLLSAVSYRVGRFVALDALIEEPRDRVAFWLDQKNTTWAEKLLTLLECPWCITIWTSFFTTLYWSLVLADWPGWWFPIYWIAVATGGVLLWVIIDPDD